MPIVYDPNKPISETNKPPEKKGVVEDVAKGAGSGIARGVVGIPGAPADILGTVTRGLNWVGRQVSGETYEDQQKRLAQPGAAFPQPQDYAPYGSEAVIGAAAPYDPTGALTYQPETTAGRVAQVAGEFTGGAIPTAGAGIWLKAGTKAEKAAALAKELIAQGIAPGAASEAAGLAADRYLGEDYGTAVRLATGIATSVAGSAAHNVTGPPTNVEVPNQGTVRSTAAANVGRGIQDTGGPAAVGQQLDQVGPGATLADASPSLRGQTEQLYIEPGASQQTVREFLNRRIADMRGSQDTVLTRALDRVINPRSANFAEETASMQQARRARAKDLYGTAERMVGDAVIPQDRALAYIDTLIPEDVRNGTAAPLPEHREMMQLRDYLSGERRFRDVDQIKDILQGRIDKEIRAGGAPSDLIEIKRQVVQSLEDATRQPDGSSVYKAAQRAYREDSGILEAQASGRDFFNPKESADQFALRWRDMSDTERQAYRLGLREAIGNKMDVAVNDFTTGSNALRTNQNTAKLRTALGDEAAEALQRDVEGGVRQRGTVQGIQNQSATAQRTRGRETIMSPEVEPTRVPLSRVQSLTGAGTAGVEWLANKWRGEGQKRAANLSNADQARLLTQDLSQLPPEQRMAALQRLQEIYETQGQRGLPANQLLLALQTAYQTDRSEENAPPSFRVRARRREEQ